MKIGGNQEKSLKLFISGAGLLSNNDLTKVGGVGIEGGVRLGLNLFREFKGQKNMLEGTLSWYTGAFFGKSETSLNPSIASEEFRFAGSGIPAKMEGLTWGVGGVGMLTSKYKNVNISSYMGTQYLKGSFGNTNLTFNHTNDALMIGDWLKKGLPPILGFQNKDENRTTELSISVNSSSMQNAFSAFARVSLFTPSIETNDDGTRKWEYNLNREPKKVNGQDIYPKKYILNKNSHGTFFSFLQIGSSYAFNSGNNNFSNVGLGYSFGNPQPLVQNKFAHGGGWRYPEFHASEGMSPNQSKSSLDFSIFNVFTQNYKK